MELQTFADYIDQGVGQIRANFVICNTSSACRLKLDIGSILNFH